LIFVSGKSDSTTVYSSKLYIALKDHNNPVAVEKMQSSYKRTVRNAASDEGLDVQSIPLTEESDFSDKTV